MDEDFCLLWTSYLYNTAFRSSFKFLKAIINPTAFYKLNQLYITKALFIKDITLP